MTKRRRALAAAFPLTIPVMAGYIFLGTAFGILMQQKGYHAGWSALMSLIVYAGSMQFVAVGLLSSGFHLVQTALMTLLVNARHLFYGIAMLDKYAGTGRKKPYLVFSLTDETFSLLCSAKIPEGVDKGWFYLFTSLLDQIYWIAGSFLGGVLGSSFSFDTKGIDFAMTALFVVIFTDQWRTPGSHPPALVGLSASVLCLLLFGPQNFLLPAMGLILVSLILLRRPLEKGGEAKC